MKAGTGIFFDGLVSTRRPVSVELKSDGISIRDPVERDQLARWPYDELDQIAAPEGVFRVARAGSKQLARLEVRDPELAATIDEASVPVDRTGAAERRSRKKVIGWSIAAVVSLVFGAVFGIPLLATQIAPLVPLRAERLLGETVDIQVRAMLDTKKAGGAFECGVGEGEARGREALDKLVRKLEVAASLPIPLRAVALRKDDTNAITLPGGRIYVFQGIIEKSETVDELAGIIAHEIGHVAHRDGTRSLIQAAGLSFMFGMLLGDFVGGGAVVLGARALLQNSYSRDVEAAADRFGVELMGKIGGDPRALGTVLARIGGAEHPGMKILLDHPETNARVAAINAAATTSGSSTPLLEAAEWAALKRICAGR
jgi:Zn-dependent protease with chaperone function